MIPQLPPSQVVMWNVGKEEEITKCILKSLKVTEIIEVQDFNCYQIQKIVILSLLASGEIGLPAQAQDPSSPYQLNKVMGFTISGRLPNRLCLSFTVFLCLVFLPTRVTPNEGLTWEGRDLLRDISIISRLFVLMRHLT